MKKTTMTLLLLVATTIYSCGGSSASSNNSTITSSSSPIIQNGIKSTPAGAFSGTWTGYLENSYTTINIQDNGNITLSAVGESSTQRLLVFKNNYYFIVDPLANKGIWVRVSGSSLIIRINGNDETFYKN